MAKYKLTEDGKAIEMKDGKPVVVEEDGKEFAIDAIGANDRVRDALKEAKEYRKKAKAAKEEAARFDTLKDIDPEDALDAISKVKNMKEDVTTQLEAQKKQINETWEAKLAEKDTTIETLNTGLFKANVLSKFATSETAKKLVLPPDIAAEYFGKHFNSDGTANDKDGNKIFSREKPGEAAGFDEALQIIVDSRPDKDAILRGTGASGSGGHQGGNGDGAGGEKSSVDLISAGLKANATV